jgi:hypothetical protein
MVAESIFEASIEDPNQHANNETLNILNEAWIFSPRNFDAKMFAFCMKMPGVPDKRAKKKTFRDTWEAGDREQKIRMEVCKHYIFEGLSFSFYAVF